MFRIYLGNLSSDVTEETLRGLFEEQGVVPVSNILLKRSFAFADCEDQETLDKAVDKLNGYKLLGFVMQVEPSMSRRRKTNKIQIKNLPANVTREDIEQLVSNTLGNAQKFEEVGAEGVVYVTFETAEQAQQAVAELHGYNLNGNLLKVELGNNRPRRTNNNNRTANTNNNAGMNRQEVPLSYRRQYNRYEQNNRGRDRPVQETPLRIVVGSEYVGAIIGKQGQTIKNITSQSRARVDIHRRDNHSQETLVTIKGSPENCTKACREIMKVVNAEAQALNKGECALKILCPNSLCGRIIGKKGAVIKGFMQESDTHIVVSSEVLSASNLPDMNNYYVDRIITITGSPEQASKAEELISEKMRACINQDAQLNYPGHQQMMFGGVQPSIPMVPNVNYRTQSQYHFMSNNMYPGLFAGATNINQPPQPQLEMIYLYIPENTVGAVIGSKGLNIKNIMRISGARIKIVQSQKNETNGQQNQIPAPRQSERKVIITGTPESQWKAQFYIFERVRAESMINEEIHLRAEILVPKSSIGRIIGKGGQNVKEMQRVSGAIVKLPEDQGDEEDVPVTIIGHFYAIQSAQRRIRSLMSNTPNLRPPRGPPRPQQNGN